MALRPVTRGQATVDKVQIATGLQAGERVITEGADRLQDGSRVVLPGERRRRAAGGGERRGARGATPRRRTAAARRTAAPPRRPRAPQSTRPTQ